MVLQLSSECNYISAYGARAKSLADVCICGGGIIKVYAALYRDFSVCIAHLVCVCVCVCVCI